MTHLTVSYFQIDVGHEDLLYLKNNKFMVKVKP